MEEDLLKLLDFELEDYIDLDFIYEGLFQKKVFLFEEYFYLNIKIELLLSFDDMYGRKFFNFL